MKLVLMVLMGLYLQTRQTEATFVCRKGWSSQMQTHGGIVTLPAVGQASNMYCRHIVLIAYVLVVYRRSWTCQMIYLVHLQEYGLHNIMTDNFKVGFAEEVCNIVFAACEEVIHTDHLHPAKSMRSDSKKVPTCTADTCALTWSPRWTRYSHKWLPTNPAPPVTRTLFLSTRGLVLMTTFFARLATCTGGDMFEPTRAELDPEAATGLETQQAHSVGRHVVDK